VPGGPAAGEGFRLHVHMAPLPPRYGEAAPGARHEAPVRVEIDGGLLAEAVETLWVSGPGALLTRSRVPPEAILRVSDARSGAVIVRGLAGGGTPEEWDAAQARRGAAAVTAAPAAGKGKGKGKGKRAAAPPGAAAAGRAAPPAAHAAPPAARAAPARVPPPTVARPAAPTPLGTPAKAKAPPEAKAFTPAPRAGAAVKASPAKAKPAAAGAAVAAAPPPRAAAAHAMPAMLQHEVHCEGCGAPMAVVLRVCPRCWTQAQDLALPQYQEQAVAEFGAVSEEEEADITATVMRLYAERGATVAPAGRSWTVFDRRTLQSHEEGSVGRDYGTMAERLYLDPFWRAQMVEGRAAPSILRYVMSGDIVLCRLMLLPPTAAVMDQLVQVRVSNIRARQGSAAAVAAALPHRAAAGDTLAVLAPEEGPRPDQWVTPLGVEVARRAAAELAAHPLPPTAPAVPAVAKARVEPQRRRRGTTPGGAQWEPPAARVPKTPPRTPARPPWRTPPAGLTPAEVEAAEEVLTWQELPPGPVPGGLPAMGSGGPDAPAGPPPGRTLHWSAAAGEWMWAPKAAAWVQIPHAGAAAVGAVCVHNSTPCACLPTGMLMLLALLVGMLLGLAYNYARGAQKTAPAHGSEVECPAVAAGTDAPSEPAPGPRECPAVKAGAPELTGELRRRREAAAVADRASSTRAACAPALEPDGRLGAQRVASRTVLTQSQCRYTYWRSHPRFEPYSGSPDGAPGSFSAEPGVGAAGW
jgi:hypothetical protein